MILAIYSILLTETFFFIKVYNVHEGFNDINMNIEIYRGNQLLINNINENGIMKNKIFIFIYIEICIVVKGVWDVQSNKFITILFWI